ncbi:MULTISPECIES: baseplate multidomain protein megatron [unclassified Paracoccus (in: a-proteobacteria)]|uniref:baseplate multidomain protein megatron n=1 Tax=unclassified Paracoccus (in: a-proteobacteria) TaxID=2688777 RepID=UPI0012B38C4F|nr:MULTISPECIES: glycoside hydrolase/phage tail family protein [unclassified Paracoccus (in: a-proteobacteria)]UXU74968.1 glycoside hydrolase/phage tail family protein [Paracoccus sp. SMMA_5]UXU80871.1 glycoside hydrolase/phage tail family protein [Paracoccus sp. SMMA_5_TC]
MATILLAAAGASLGAGFGGTVLGLSGAVIGRAVGATLGRVIDQRLLGAGSKAVETGRLDRIRIQTAGEGTPIPRLWGQMRVPGHAIWAGPLQEVQRKHGGGKGTSTSVTEISYRLSFALALCEGPILGVGRIWADGEEVSPDDLNLRVYLGDETQLPDPAIAAQEGDEAPAYRGLAYVVMEDLALEKWGNRVPQLSFEVTRAAKAGRGLSRQVQAVAMIPGTGEYSLATSAVSYDLGLGETAIVNRNTALGRTDFEASLRTLGRELPRVGSVSLVVSWFGDDMRVGHCTVRPKVEDAGRDGREMAWRAGGIGRDAATEVARVGGRPIYGGTPADGAVIQALRAIADSGRKAVFYPFILMEQLAGNLRPDPWTGATSQPVMPWRGRITTSVAPGRPGTPFGTAAARAEVDRFFGAAEAGDFVWQGDSLVYQGPDEWSYRRFILHYAHLCARAGGIDSFLIGSEMVGLTQIMAEGRSFPAVEHLRRLAADVRAILGPQVKLSYAADWSEYFGYQPGNGDAYFHLDPLWADDNIDYIGIDNYMPLSDWRDGEDHLDAHWGRIDNPDYLRANVAGGEGYDWYYATEADRQAQVRTPIRDGAHHEHWLWRYKDIRNWWQNPHHNRIGGVRQAQATAWVPRSKPIWFTEMGCAALDKGTNQPNKFLDAMSSESMLPYFSEGRRDDAMQAAYVRAMTEYWSDLRNNPPCAASARMPAGRMVDVSRAHVWCWDARPFPAFPARTDLWSDGPAWQRGHWLNGRAGAVPLEDVVSEICTEAGVRAHDASALSGLVRGYVLNGGESGRAALQALMVTHGFDAVESDGVLRFVMRTGRADINLGADDLAMAEDLSGPEITRMPDADIAGRIRLSHVEAGGDYALRTTEASQPGGAFLSVADSELPMALTRAEGQALAQRWLAESGIARETLRLALPPSRGNLVPGQVLRLSHGQSDSRLWRIDRVERAGAIILDTVRVEPGPYRVTGTSLEDAPIRPFVPPVPMLPVFLDLPLLRGDEEPHAPYLAVTATPWPGAAAVWMSATQQGGYALNTTIARRSIIGVTTSPLAAARPGVWDRGAPLRLRIKGGVLESANQQALLSGANLMAIGDGTPEGWELFQFAEARLVATGEWEIAMRLRGQAGTDAFMPEVWPAGSRVVLLDGAARQVDLSPSARNQIRHWRIGPSARPPGDDSYRAASAAFRGAGLRPLTPCHLRVQDGLVTWIRRTRVQGDDWDGLDVPLGEAGERYSVRLIQNGSVLAQAIVAEPRWTIPPAPWALARAGGPYAVEVAQISETFGPGPYARSEFNA